MIIEVLTICSLVATGPYYDCSESWDIIILENYQTFQWCKEFNSQYCAKWNPKRIYIDRIGFSEWFYHEVKHLQCECNLH